MSNIVNFSNKTINLSQAIETTVMGSASAYVQAKATAAKVQAIHETAMAKCEKDPNVQELLKDLDCLTSIFSGWSLK